MLEGLDIARVQARGCRPERVRDIGEIWSPVLRILGTRTDVTTLRDTTVPTYEGKRRAEGAAGQTIRREVQALRRGIRMAVLGHILPRSPINWDALDDIEADPINEAQASKSWTETEIRKVLANLSAKAKRHGIRDAMWAIRLTGLRLEEAKRYERSTWLRGKILRVPATGKNGQPRDVHLDREALRLLQKYERLPIRKPNKALKLASSRAGFDQVLTPRDLRSFRITELAQHSVVAARDQAGHKSLTTTSRYVKPTAEHVRSVALTARKGATRSGPQRKKAGQKSKQKQARARSSAG